MLRPHLRPGNPLSYQGLSDTGSKLPFNARSDRGSGLRSEGGHQPWQWVGGAVSPPGHKWRPQQENHPHGEGREGSSGACPALQY